MSVTDLMGYFVLSVMTVLGVFRHVSVLPTSKEGLR